jgi:hypothetical protein
MLGQSGNGGITIQPSLTQFCSDAERPRLLVAHERSL